VNKENKGNLPDYKMSRVKLLPPWKRQIIYWPKLGSRFPIAYWLNSGSYTGKVKFECQLIKGAVNLVSSTLIISCLDLFFKEMTSSLFIIFVSQERKDFLNFLTFLLLWYIFKTFLFKIVLWKIILKHVRKQINVITSADVTNLRLRMCKISWGRICYCLEI
jgi:hypothetical protein